MSRDDLSSRKMKIHTILEVANCELAYHNACRYLYGKSKVQKKVNKYRKSKKFAKICIHTGCASVTVTP